METVECYSLDELIEVLNNIYIEGDGPFNMPKAFYTLAKEIKEIKQSLLEES